MKKLKLADLNEAVRSFVTGIGEGESVLVEDETGRARYGVIPFREAPPEEQEAAWQDIQDIQREAGDRMRARGQTEEDLDRILQEDD